MAAHVDDLKRAALGAALVPDAVGVHTIRSEGAAPFELVYGGVYFGGAFVLGRVVRRRAVRGAAIEPRSR